MAEAFGLASSILGVAELGLSLTKSLYRFAGAYRGADAQLEEIEGRVSVTASILTELAGIVQSNQQYFKRNPTGALEAPVSSCERDYKKLRDAIRESKGEDMAKSKLTAWARFKWALGGEESTAELLLSLKTSKEDLSILIELFNYRLLIESRRDHVLTPETTEMLSELKAQLPILVQLLRERGLVSNGPSIRPQDTHTSEDSDEDNANGKDNIKVPNPPTANGTVYPSQNNPTSPPSTARSSHEEAPGLHDLQNPNPPFPQHTTDPIYEAWTFTGEIVTRRHYPATKIPLTQQALLQLVHSSRNSRSPSVLETLSSYPPAIRDAVNQLIEDSGGSENKEADLGIGDGGVGVAAIQPNPNSNANSKKVNPRRRKKKQKTQSKSWVKRLGLSKGRRRSGCGDDDNDDNDDNDDDDPQDDMGSVAKPPLDVIFVLQKDHETFGPPWASPPPAGSTGPGIAPVTLPLPVPQMRMSSYRTPKVEAGEWAAAGADQEVAPEGEELPSPEEAEELMDRYLAGFTTFDEHKHEREHEHEHEHEHDKLEMEM